MANIFKFFINTNNFSLTILLFNYYIFKNFFIIQTIILIKNINNVNNLLIIII